MALNAQGWRLAKTAYSKFKLIIFWTVSRSQILTTIYFALTPYYRREQRALVSGLLRHMRDLKQDASFFLLRRNIHRIEKGLVMPDRRPLFAVEYIGETVDYYTKCLEKNSDGNMSAELTWASDVLHQYFASVSSHPYVKVARASFLNLAPKKEGESLPYSRGRAEAPVTYDNLMTLAHQRKSVRTFLKKPVPRELIDKALALASRAPSSCNRQPVCYRIFDEGPLLREMRQLPLGTAGFAENIPMICALTGDQSAYFYERDRHSIYIDGSLSAMLFMLALETVGLASCPLNWAEIASLDRRFEKLSGLPPHERPIMFIAIGYPDPNGKVAFSERKALESLRTYNHVDEVNKDLEKNPAFKPSKVET